MQYDTESDWTDRVIIWEYRKDISIKTTMMVDMKLGRVWFQRNYGYGVTSEISIRLILPIWVSNKKLIVIIVFNVV